MVIREGHGMPSMNEQVGSSWDHVTPGYLETMDQHILRGRTITEQDTASTQNIAVVNEAFVKRFFKPGEDPIGQHFGLDLPQYGATFQIVGIVNDARYMWDNLFGTAPTRPLFFVPLAQHVHYDNAMMQSIDDETHYIEGAVLKYHSSMVLIGLLIGIPASIGCSRLISSQLCQVRGWDPLVLIGCVFALALSAVLASVIPAQRAASINPVKALRTE
jgi:hypothetical protein